MRFLKMMSILVLLVGVSISVPTQAQDFSWAQTSDGMIIRTGPALKNQGDSSSSTLWAGCNGYQTYPETGWWPKASGGQGDVLGNPILWVQTPDGFIVGIGNKLAGVMSQEIGIGKFSSCDSLGTQIGTAEMLPIVENEFLGSESFFALYVQYKGQELTASELSFLGLEEKIRPAELDLSFKVSLADTLVVPTFNGGNPQSLVWATNCISWSAPDAFQCEVFAGNGKSFDTRGFVFTDDRKVVGYVVGGSWNSIGPEAWLYIQLFSNEESIRTAFSAVTVDTEEEIPVPSSLKLSKPYPIPAINSARIVVRIDRPQYIRAEVYDILGQRVTVLHDGILSSGEHTFRFDGTALTNGIYLVRFQGEREVRTSQIVLMK